MFLFAQEMGYLTGIFYILAILLLLILGLGVLIGFCIGRMGRKNRDELSATSTKVEAATISESIMADDGIQVADHCAACGAKITPAQARCPSCDIAVR